MRTCVVCGCTDDDACVREVTLGPGGRQAITCAWPSHTPDVCTFCAEECECGTDPVVDAPQERSLILPGDPDYHL